VSNGTEPTMTVFDKLDPRAGGESWRPLGWWAAAAVVAAVLAAAAATRLGASDLAAAVWLALSVPAVLSWLVFAEGPDAKVSARWRLAIVAAGYLSSSAAALASIVPGFELASGTLAGSGDELVVEIPRAGMTTSIAVSGTMPRERPRPIAYELRAGDQQILGAIECSTGQFRIGNTVQRRGSEHGAAVYTVALPAGRNKISLVHLGGEIPDGLRVAVFDAIVPPWVTATFAVLAFAALLWFLAIGRAAAPVAMSAGVSVGFALAMCVIATPLRPLRGSVLALVAAVPLGTLGGALGLAAVQQIKRARERLRRRSARTVRPR
jgi:hypothetical protein